MTTKFITIDAGYGPIEVSMSAFETMGSPWHLVIKKGR